MEELLSAMPAARTVEADNSEEANAYSAEAFGCDAVPAETECTQNDESIQTAVYLQAPSSLQSATPSFNLSSAHASSVKQVKEADSPSVSLSVETVAAAHADTGTWTAGSKNSIRVMRGGASSARREARRLRRRTARLKQALAYEIRSLLESCIFISSQPLF